MVLPIDYGSVCECVCMRACMRAPACGLNHDISAVTCEIHLVKYIILIIVIRHELIVAVDRSTVYIVMSVLIKF